MTIAGYCKPPGRLTRFPAEKILEAARELFVRRGYEATTMRAIVRYRFGDNAELRGAWGRAHNVVGPFMSSPPGPLSLRERGDDTPGVVKPAA
jgi:hypothetical protein